MKKFFNSENLVTFVIILAALAVFSVFGSTLTGWLTKAKNTVTG